MSLKELDRDAAIVPAAIATSPVLAHQIVFDELVAEVVLDAGPAAHERAPQRLLADFVLRVDHLALAVPAVKSLVAQVGALTVGGAAGFVEGHDPRFAGFGRCLDPLHRLRVRVLDVAVLQRNAGQTWIRSPSSGR